MDGCNGNYFPFIYFLAQTRDFFRTELTYMDTGEVARNVTPTAVAAVMTAVETAARGPPTAVAALLQSSWWLQ